MSDEASLRRHVTAAIVTGVGLGGFVDGIVFHQILQWHNVLSSVVVPVDVVKLKYNMVFDGVFHAATWVVTVLGVVLSWRASRRHRTPAPRTFAGSLAIGWGLFNLVEGVVDHHALAIHHVHPGLHELEWDIAFLVFGAALVLLGRALLRLERPRERREPASSHSV